MAIPTFNKPPDFDMYWQDVLQGLAQLAPSPEISPIPLLSSSFATMYEIRLTSIGPYRIFGYLSIPKSRGPFPSICYLPRYQSVPEPLPQGETMRKRRRYITFSIAVRGQRKADQPFSASFPGLLTEGIEDPSSYIFRGIVADCCRGVEYLLSAVPAVDPERIVVVGNDLAIMTAALRPQLTHVVCTPSIFYGTSELAPLTHAYPLEEINDYLRLYPESENAIKHTLSYFDLRGFAPRVQATTLIMSQPTGSLLGPESLESLLESMHSPVDIHPSQRSFYRDGILIDQWITHQFGFRKPILPRYWEK